MNAINDLSLAEKVRHYSQEQGFTDEEIGVVLKLSRKTIVLIRKEHKIPKSNINNRRDKALMCATCKEVYYVKRSSKLGEELCPKCNPKSV